MRPDRVCPDCDESAAPVDRRGFLKSMAASAAAAAVPLWTDPRSAVAAPTPRSNAEQAPNALYATLSDVQKRTVCFPWEHTEPMSNRSRGLLRTHISNNWQITQPQVRSNFYTRDQQTMIFDI